MSNLVHTQKQALAELQGSRLAVRSSPVLARRIDQAVADGLVSAARIETAGYVTHVAISEVAAVSTAEVWAVESCPSMEPLHKAQVAGRVALLVDNFTAVAAGEITGLRY